MKLAIASEHAGYNLKNEIYKYLREKGMQVEDLGVYSDEPTDYPLIAAGLAERVVEGEFNKGILICGTGIGMSIAAGKVPRVRAALCTDPYMAKMAREHNNSNVLCLGSWITGLELSFAIVDAFLQSEFTGNQHTQRIDLTNQLEDKYGSRIGRGIL